MAHLLSLIESKPKTKIKIPNISGRFGFSLFVGGKEIFLGVAINDVIQEVVYRKRVKVQKGTGRSFQFDPLNSGD